jgi:tetratricopeptide (TPR) repeat protein
VAIARGMEDQHTIANFLANAGFIYLQQNRFNQAREVYSEALAIYDELADEQGMADTGTHLGLIAFYEEDHARAGEYYQKSLTIWERLGDRNGVVYAQHLLGDAAYKRGEYEAAAGWYAASLRGAVAIGFQLIIASALEGMALIAAARQDSRRARQLAGAAADLRRLAAFPASAARQQFLAAGLAPAGDNEEALLEDQAAARPLTLDEALAIALEI